MPAKLIVLSWTSINNAATSTLLALCLFNLISVFSLLALVRALVLALVMALVLAVGWQVYQSWQSDGPLLFNMIAEWIHNQSYCHSIANSLLLSALALLWLGSCSPLNYLLRAFISPSCLFKFSLLNYKCSILDWARSPTAINNPASEFPNLWPSPNFLSSLFAQHFQLFHFIHPFNS